MPTTSPARSSFSLRWLAALAGLLGSLSACVSTSAGDPPPACPESLQGLLGEYENAGEVLVAYESQGRLGLVRTAGEGRDELARGTSIRFAREPDGRARALFVDDVRYERRRFDGDGESFRIEPRLPLSELRERAREARPPLESGKRPNELVDLRTVEGLAFDLRYATADNFLGVALYELPEAWAQRPAAEALARVQAWLEPRGYGLLIHDALRPWRVTKMFWDATPEPLRGFVADPAQGSRHNRGCAIDLTLVELASGRAVAMVSGYDEFSPRSAPDYPGGTERERWHRALLIRAMSREGFEVHPNEWWHFDHATWRDYPLIEGFPVR